MRRRKTGRQERGETGRKLVLRPETLRRLEDGALKRVAGGQPTVQGHHCDSNVHCL